MNPEKNNAIEQLWKSLSERDRDKWVAECVLGIQVHTDENGIEYVWRDGIKKHNLYYSTNINDAWKIVETLGSMALQAPGSTDMNENYRNFEEWTCDFKYTHETEATGKTAEEAICKAALFTKLIHK